MILITDMISKFKNLCEHLSLQLSNIRDKMQDKLLTFYEMQHPNIHCTILKHFQIKFF